MAIKTEGTGVSVATKCSREKTTKKSSSFPSSKAVNEKTSFDRKDVWDKLSILSKVANVLFVLVLVTPITFYFSNKRDLENAEAKKKEIELIRVQNEREQNRHELEVENQKKREEAFVRQLNLQEEELATRKTIARAQVAESLFEQIVGKDEEQKYLALRIIGSIDDVWTADLAKELEGFQTEEAGSPNDPGLGKLKMVRKRIQMGRNKDEVFTHIGVAERYMSVELYGRAAPEYEQAYSLIKGDPNKAGTIKRSEKAKKLFDDGEYKLSAEMWKSILRDIVADPN